MAQERPGQLAPDLLDLDRVQQRRGRAGSSAGGLDGADGQQAVGVAD